MPHTLGIDLGTTFSAIAVVDHTCKPAIISNREGERITPSVVLFDGGSPIVGTIAKQSAIGKPLNVVQFVKRQMGNPSWKFRAENGESFTPEEISAIILRRLKEDAESFLGEPVKGAVITVPAYFDDAQRKATHDAGRIAGLHVRRIINEPTAAALAYAFDDFQKRATGNGSGSSVPLDSVRGEKTILVYDLGGGTFDVTVMRIQGGDIQVIATGGDKNLGGFDWDNEIMKFLNDEFKRQAGVDLYDDPEFEQQLRDKAEVAKKTLSGRDKANVLLIAGGKSASMVLTRDHFEEMTAPLLKRTAKIMEFVLEDARLRWSDVDKVLLTGGSTRMRGVPALVEQVTGKRASNELHPDEVVALGAALQGAILDEAEATQPTFPLVRVKDINSHSMGIVSLNEDEVDVNSIVLAKGTLLPCHVSKTFYTVVDNQTKVRVLVTEGEDTDLQYVKIVGEGEMEIPPYPEEAPIDVHFEYDHDGIIHVRVFDATGKKWLGELLIQRTSNLTEEDVEEKRIKLSACEVN